MNSIKLNNLGKEIIFTMRIILLYYYTITRNQRASYENHHFYVICNLLKTFNHDSNVVINPNQPTAIYKSNLCISFFLQIIKHEQQRQVKKRK